MTDQTVILTPNTSFPKVFNTQGGGTATVLAYVTINEVQRYVGVSHEGEGLNYATMWDKQGSRVYSDNHPDRSNPDNLICNNQKTREAFSALSEPDRRIVVAIYAASRNKKIHGIKAIRAVTNWGLTEAKYAHEELLPSVAAAYGF